MARTIILSLEELIGLAQAALEPTLGEQAAQADYASIIAVLLTDYCSHEVGDSYDQIRDMLEGYGVSSDLAEDVQATLRERFTCQMYRTVGPLDGDWHYSYRLTANGTVYLYQEELSLRLRRNPTPVRSLLEMLADEVSSGIEEGDWYPERILRTVGAR